MEDFEGDILLTKVQKAMTTPFHLDVAAAGVWAQADFLWPERIVPYYIPPDLGKINNTLDFFFVFLIRSVAHGALSLIEHPLANSGHVVFIRPCMFFRDSYFSG